MTAIVWKTEYETGVPFIDQDHHVLVELLNQAHATRGDAEEGATLGSILNALIDYTDYHFAREEKLMALVGYADATTHRAAHAALRQQVVDIRDKYEADPASIHAEDVTTFLNRWLVDHILARDLNYRDKVFAGRDKWVEAETFRFDSIVDEGPELDQAGIDWAALDVLAVDDNINFRVMLKTLLTALGVEKARCVDSAEAALDAMKERPADIILCDWMMGGMNGLEMVRALRKGGVAAKIIMMTGYADADTRAEAARAGVDVFLEKPITAKGFLEAVGAVIRRG